MKTRHSSWLALFGAGMFAWAGCSSESAAPAEDDAGLADGGPLEDAADSAAPIDAGPADAGAACKKAGGSCKGDSDCCSQDCHSGHCH